MAYKTCPDCGSRMFEHGCVNCNEPDYISMQGAYDSPDETIPHPQGEKAGQEGEGVNWEQYLASQMTGVGKDSTVPYHAAYSICKLLEQSAASLPAKGDGWVRVEELESWKHLVRKIYAATHDPKIEQLISEFIPTKS